MVKPRVRSQPSPTTPAWLSHRKLGSPRPPSHSLRVRLQSLSVSLSVSVSPRRSLLTAVFFCVCINWSICLFVSISHLLFSPNEKAHTYTHARARTLTQHCTRHPLHFPACQSVTASGLVQQAGFSWAPQTHGSQSAFSRVLEWYFFVCVCVYVCALFVFQCCLVCSVWTHLQKVHHLNPPFVCTYVWGKKKINKKYQIAEDHMCLSPSLHCEAKPAALKEISNAHTWFYLSLLAQSRNR